MSTSPSIDHKIDRAPGGLPSPESDLANEISIAKHAGIYKPANQPKFIQRVLALEALWAAIKDRSGWKLGYNGAFTDACERLRWLESRGDITGIKFGRLTALKPFDSEPGRGVKWLCRCDCGNEHIVIKGSLSSGGTKSCGCLRIEAAIKRTQKPKGVASFNQLFVRYKQSATKRSIGFHLNREQFLDIVTKDCHYCGASPERMATGPRLNGQFKYNGIDRQDNNGPYEIGNVVAACWVCNQAKKEMSVDDFIRWAKRLGGHQIALGSSPAPCHDIQLSESDPGDENDAKINLHPQGQPAVTASSDGVEAVGLAPAHAGGAA